ncbi:MAG: hypothetical protein A2086_04180 [Spirochaetes bacterium GWD1_27_9]|nr:MAG: hypothetical protein A2Z98_06515 [Spirochaetes bacterium GWB1_27_13]OHD27548.1 MAG: hypothetical protein A2Y34_13835 [Spirochaetes bacterium GWC1_27_15]OHD44742.1 MAG: hypothetical protein A2086_04180 [Spirochaetes bacterium GWD1_27_9]
MKNFVIIFVFFVLISCTKSTVQKTNLTVDSFSTTTIIDKSKIIDLNKNIEKEIDKTEIKENTNLDIKTKENDINTDKKKTERVIVTPTTTVRVPIPQIVVENYTNKSSYNMGIFNIFFDATLKGKIAIKNTGDADLEINNIYFSDGNASNFRLEDSYNKTIKSGKFSNVVFYFNDIDTTGDKFSTLNIQSNDKKTEIYTINIKIKVIDNLKFIKQVDTPGESYSLVSDSNKLYIADGKAGLQVIDITNPQNPNLIKSIDTPGEAYGVFVDKNYLYVSDHSNGIVVFDKNNLTEITTINTNGEAYSTITKDNYLYVADGNKGFKIYDISDIKASILLKEIETRGPSKSIFIKNNSLYIVDELAGIKVFDISNPLKIMLQKNIDTPGTANSVFINNGFAYVADGRNGLVVLNVKDNKGAYVNSISVSGNISESVYIYNNFLYLGDGANGMQIIDIKDPANPVINRTIKTQGAAFGTLIYDRYIFICNWDRGIAIYGEKF